MKKVIEKRIIIFFYIFFIVIIMTCSFVSFFKDINKSEVVNTKNQLKEISEQSSVAVKTKLKNSLEYINGVSNIIFNENYEDKFVIENVLNEFLDKSDFDSIFIIDRNGNFISTDYTFSDELKNIYNQYEDDIFIVNIEGKNALVFSSSKKSQNDDVVYGLYTIDELEEILYITSFYGEGYTHIFNSSGSIILKSPHYSSEYTTNNIIEIFDNSTMKKGYTVENFKNDLKKGNGGFIHYVYENIDERYAYYMPVGISDFYIISIVPSSAIARYAINIKNAGVLLLASIISIFAITELLAYFNRSNSNKKIIIANKLMEVNKERYLLAADISESAVFEYIIKDSTVVFKNIWYKKYFDTDVIKNISHHIYSSKYIKESFKNDIVMCFRDIDNGKKEAECEMAVNVGDEKYEWFKIKMTSIYDENGNPIKAVGTAHNITSLKETEIKYLKMGQYKNIIISNAIFSCEINVSQNTVNNIRYRNRIISNDNISLSELIQSINRKYIIDNKKYNFLDVFSIESLKTMYKNGKKEVSLRYKRYHEDSYTWSEIFVYVTESLENGDIVGIMFVLDIDNTVKEEEKLKYDAEIDRMTQIYNKSTTEFKIKDCINDNISGILFVIDMDGFKNINDTYGHMAGDYVLKEFSKKLKSIFRSSDIVGRIGGDEFCVFAKNINSIIFAERKGDEIFSIFKSEYKYNGSILPVSGTIGISIFPENGNTYNEIFSKADKALYHAKHLGKAQYSIYDEEDRK